MRHKDELSTKQNVRLREIRVRLPHEASSRVESLKASNALIENATTLLAERGVHVDTILLVLSSHDGVRRTIQDAFAEALNEEGLDPLRIAIDF